MLLDQITVFMQEWGLVIALLVCVALAMAADLFPKLGRFMREVEQRYPHAVDFLFNRERYVIDCYDRLPVRIKAGFALIGGKVAWAWLVTWMYRYLRSRLKKV
ncbi:hypothetical protein [Brevibacillus sp. H7]|uniref:hypothetical protein n=1 Tax=Brevibacillus sp. H7 TaxID=3349138 RepID=UPI0038140D8F